MKHNNMDNGIYSTPTKAGTAGGFLTIILVNLNSEEIIKTVVLAALGASVSFIISLCWKTIVKKMRKG